MNGSSPQQTLLIFVKNPIPGRVKTRLGKTIGHPAAVKVYQKLLQHTKNQSLQVAAQRQVWYGKTVAKEDLWTNAHFSKHLQPQLDLGQRMAHAFKAAFAQGAQKVVVIGSDCPELTGEILNQAYEALNEKQVVVGPAHDGGYYLLGLRQWQPIFDQINWSTSQVLSQTLQKIEKLNLSYQLLARLSDLDTIEDLKQFPKYDPST